MTIKTFHDVNRTTVTKGDCGDSVMTFLHNRAQARADAITQEPVARPLFAPAVKTTITPEEDAELTAVLNSLGGSDFDLSVPEKTRILALCDSIDLTSHQYITDYGIDAGHDEMMSAIDEFDVYKDYDKVKQLLQDVMKHISKVQIENIKRPTGFLKKMFSDVLTEQDFNFVDMNVQILVKECICLLKKVSSGLPQIEQQIEDINKQFRMLSVYVIAGQMRLNKEDATQNNVSGADFFQQQRQADFKVAVDRFRRRVDSLIKIRVTILLKMKQIRMEYNNILSTIDQVTDLVTFVVPTWKQQIQLLFSNSKNADNNTMFDEAEEIQRQLVEKLTTFGVKNV